MIYNVGITAGGGVTDKALEASMIFADGTKKTVTIDAINGADIATLIAAGSPSGITATDSTNNMPAGTTVTGGTIAAASKTIEELLIGELVNYKINNDGNYEVWNLTHDGSAYAAPTNGDVLGYDGISASAGTYNPVNSQISGYELADDAVVFFYQGTANTAASTNEAYVYTGKQIKDSQVTGTGSFNDYGTALYGKSNGFTYAQVAVLGAATEPGILSGTAYGYLLADSYTRYEGGKTYAYFTYWNGSESVDARAESYDANKYKAGAIVTFDVVSAATDTERQLVKDLKAPSALSIGQVDGWDKVSKIGLDTNREITDDTVIFYIDSQKGTAQEGNIGMIRDASDVTGDGVKENNVYYIPVGTKDIALLVVDINNNMKLIPAAYSGNMAAASDLDAALAAGWSEVVVGADLTGAASATVKAGQTLKFTSAQSQNHTITVEPGAYVEVPNGKLIGGSDAAFSSTGTVTMNTNSGHVQLAASTGIITLNGDATIDDGDSVTLTGSATLVATAGTTLTVDDSGVSTAVLNFYTNNATAGTANDNNTYTYYAANTIIKTDGTNSNNAAGWYTATAVAAIKT